MLLALDLQDSSCSAGKAKWRRLHCKRVCSHCASICSEAAWLVSCLFLYLIKMYYIYTLSLWNVSFFLFSPPAPSLASPAFVAALLMVGLAGKQMLSFCLSACVIRVICICMCTYPIYIKLSPYQILIGSITQEPICKCIALHFCIDSFFCLFSFASTFML